MIGGKRMSPLAFGEFMKLLVEVIYMCYICHSRQSV